MTERYIFDANFFINVHQTYPQPIVCSIARSVKEIGGVPHVTHLILGEVSSLRYPDRGHVVDDIEKCFQIDHVSTHDIEALEARIGGKEVSPQHPDLSLMVLGNELGRTQKVTLVSDDFKIHTTQVKHGLNFKVVSPSAFLLDLSNKEMDSTFRKTYRRMYRQVRRKEMEYMLSRRDTYSIEPKLTWLVDNLLGSGTGNKAQKGPRIVPITDKIHVDMDPIYRYIAGEKVRRSKIAAFDNIIHYIDFLKEAKGVDEEVRLHVEHGEFNGALQVVKTGKVRLRRTLQSASLKVDVMDGIKIRQIFSHYLAHYNFMMAFLSLSKGYLLLAEECLDAAGFCALITRDNDDIVKASYIKALIYFSMDDYVEAHEQFKATVALSRTLGLHEMEFKANLGNGITAFLRGNRKEAEETVAQVHEMVGELGMEATPLLLAFANKLQNFGRPEVAMSVYNEALESALEWGQKKELEIIEKAMKQCNASLSNIGLALDSDLSHLIEKANDLCDECRDAYYKEVQEIVKEEAVMLKPLDVTVEEWTPGRDLPPAYRKWMEVVKFVPVREPLGGGPSSHTIVIGYIQEIGTLGIYLEGTKAHKSVEKFKVRLKDGGVFKILNAPDHYQRRYGLRGVVGIKEADDVELKHLLFGDLPDQDG